MQDERKNLPSASAMNRIAACPGSFLISLDCPPEDRDTSARDSGDRVHMALRTRNFSCLESAEELGIANRCLSILDTFLESRVTPGVKRYTERRLWLRSLDRFSHLMSGQADLLFLKETGFPELYVIDWKAGRVPVPHPKNNWQIKSEIVMAREIFDFDFAYGVIIQPAVSDKAIVQFFETYEFSEMNTLLRDILRRAMEPSAPRIPGPCCDFCPAKAICPEANGVALSPLKWRDTSLTGAQLAAELPLYDLIEEVIQARRTLAARIKAASPAAMPGYDLEPGTEPEFIEDTAAAFQTVSKHLTIDEFLSVCSVSISELRKLWARRFRLSPHEAKTAVRETFGQQLKKRTTNPRLKKIA